MPRTPAYLLLADGTRFDGFAFGARGASLGEVVFNTSMTGYQEILTDPSYAEQLVAMTYPHIGNYGTTPLDNESRRPWVKGFIAREFSRRPSNFRSERSIGQWLEDHGVVSIDGLDTRALTRRLRDVGAMNGILVNDGTPIEEAHAQLAAYPGLQGLDLGGRVTCAEPWSLEGPEGAPHIVALDFGIKLNIAKELARRARVTVVPATTSLEAIRALEPDGVMLSNGPGDPEPIAAYAADTVRGLLGTLPVMGICMGQQVLALALGARTYKLKFGHRGGNHPVKNLHTGRVEITSHNHGYSVDEHSLPEGAVVTHRSLSDGTLEGFEVPSLGAFCVQYHPEANPGPHDASYLFDQFITRVREARA